ncbi:MAG TPA: hypothetical protein VFB21_12415 [Chthonomonadaceae bacterium]|nr:hypothetical protein [Chthonomonadaceae bacterium]
MAFRYTEQNREEYFSIGLTVLRGLIPAPLLADLRREADKARVLARQKNGPQAQRLQPVYAYDQLDPQPFRDFLALPALREAVAKILGPGHAPSQNMGILLEPAEKAWCTNWHRDWGHHVEGLDMEEFYEAARNPRLFNQLNGALYDDHSFWVVPGSHDRPDTPEEAAAFGAVPAPGPALTDTMTPEEREMACTEYARRMPGATQIVLRAGDVAFYRASAWHIGSYVPYARRATLHDGFYGAEEVAWQERMRQVRESRRAAA